MKNIKALKVGRNILMALIACYIMIGLLSQIFSASADEFYADLFDSPNNYDLYLMASRDFKKSREKLSENLIPSLVECLKSEERTLANLGEHKNDRFMNLSLISDKQRYDLAFKWRVNASSAYITGVERKVDLRDGDIVHRSNFGKLGGNCFHEVLTQIE